MALMLPAGTFGRDKANGTSDTHHQEDLSTSVHYFLAPLFYYPRPADFPVNRAFLGVPVLVGWKVVICGINAQQEKSANEPKPGQGVRQDQRLRKARSAWKVSPRVVFVCRLDEVVLVDTAGSWQGSEMFGSPMNLVPMVAQVSSMIVSICCL